MYARDVPPGTIFYHGTKADLKAGDLISPGFGSNFVERGLKHIYFSATLEAAIWGAELARGEGLGRIYIVEPTGEFDDDPNSPTRNSRATSPPSTARPNRCGSPARSSAGSAIRPSSSSRCATISPGRRPKVAPRSSRTERGSTKVHARRDPAFRSL